MRDLILNKGDYCSTDTRGVTNLPHYKEFSSRELKSSGRVKFRFRNLTILLVFVVLLDEFNPHR